MNQGKMLLLFSMALLCAACQEGKEDVKEPVSENVLYANVGEEVPLATALEWIDEYDRNISGEGREALLQSFSIPRQTLLNALGSVENLVGVAFHYAYDPSGSLHILAIPIDDDMELWPGSSTRTIIDAKTGTSIHVNQARAWAMNYKVTHPDDVWYHFFGKTIFDDMQALPYFNSVEIARGIHTLELTPEMLLIVWNDIFSLGRTQDGPGTAYDASNPCPPCIIEDPDKP